jgi:hypothetical protein
VPGGIFGSGKEGGHQEGEREGEGQGGRGGGQDMGGASRFARAADRGSRKQVKEKNDVFALVDQTLSGGGGGGGGGKGGG